MGEIAKVADMIQISEPKLTSAMFEKAAEKADEFFAKQEKARADRKAKYASRKSVVHSQTGLKKVNAANQVAPAASDSGGIVTMSKAQFKKKSLEELCTLAEKLGVKISTVMQGSKIFVRKAIKASPKLKLERRRLAARAPRYSSKSFESLCQDIDAKD